MSYTSDQIAQEFRRRINEGYYTGFGAGADNLADFASPIINTQAARDSYLQDIRDVDAFQRSRGIGGMETGIGSMSAYDLINNYFNQNPFASTPVAPTPTPIEVPMLDATQAGQLGQIPGIASNVAGLGQDRAYGSTQGQIKAQTDKIGGIASDVTNLGQNRAYGSTQQQILNRQGYTGGLPGQTLAGGIGGLYSDRALGSAQQDIRGDITGQTTALQNYISNQIGDVTANQALQDTNLKSILGNVGEGGTLANQLTTRANTLDQGIEGLQTTGDTAAKSLSALLGGQETLGGNIGGLATDFGDFNKQYTNDQADARTFRTDTRASILGGQQQIQDAMGGNLGQRIDQVARNVDRQRTDQQQDFAGVARLIAANAPPQTQQDLVERGRFRESLDKIRSAIQSNPNIDQRTRATYSALANSFDANGKLNAVSVKQDGGLVSRSFDDQGQVVINQLGPQGEDMGVSPLSLNVNQLLNDAEAGGVQQQQQLPAALMRQVSNDSERFNRPVQGLGAPQV